MMEKEQFNELVAKEIDELRAKYKGETLDWNKLVNIVCNNKKYKLYKYLYDTSTEKDIEIIAYIKGESDLLLID